MTSPDVSWAHRPDHPTAAEHVPFSDTTCFGCVCYGCGMPTDGPRDLDKGCTHTGSTDHRWCFDCVLDVTP